VAEGSTPLRDVVSFMRRRLAEGCDLPGCSARSLGICFQRLFWLLLSDCFPFCSEHYWNVLFGILPCLWSSYSCLLLGIYAMPLEYLFMPLSSSFELLLCWFLDSLLGSWFVFIVEMNTLFGCFWAELEYEYVVVDPWVSFGG